MSVLLATKLQKAAVFNIFFVAIVWTGRVLGEGLRYSEITDTFLDILGAFLMAYGIALHIPWVEKKLGLRIEYTDELKTKLENKKYSSGIILLH